MNGKLTTIGFDADDTLWHCEKYFKLTQETVADLLRDYTDPNHLSERLLAAERRNLGLYGFGVKGFVLSMIEAAIEVTDGKVPGHVIHQLIAAGQEMLREPIDVLPHVRDCIETLAGDFQLIVITKGDLLDQERKVAQSGLGEMFDAVEIVSDKTSATYREIFDRHGSGATSAMMVGNSMKSDVVPALEAGSWGVFVPQDLSWELEHHPVPKDQHRYRQIDNLGDLPELIKNT